MTPDAGARSGPVMARYADRGGLVPQGTSAEMIAEKWNLSREDLDAYGARSQQFAATGPTDEGRFEREILPVEACPSTRRPASSSRPTSSSPRTRASAPTPPSRPSPT